MNVQQNPDGRGGSRSQCVCNAHLKRRKCAFKSYVIHEDKQPVLKEWSKNTSHIIVYIIIIIWLFLDFIQK